jgi:hypothetical protein
MDLVGDLALPYPIHVVYGMMGFLTMRRWSNASPDRH